MLDREVMDLIPTLSDDTSVAISLVFGHLAKLAFTEFAISVCWMENILNPLASTLATAHKETNDISAVKSSKIGSSDARYFTGSDETQSKSDAVEKMANEQYISLGDQDLKQLLKLPGLPLQLRELNIEVNYCVFTNKSFPNLCSTPDGVAIIDGVLCPVEMTRDLVSIEMDRVCRTDQIANDLSSLSRETRIQRVEEKSKEVVRLRKLKMKAKQEKKDDPDHSPPRKTGKKGKPARSRERSREQSLSVLSRQTHEQIAECHRHNRTKSQRSRRHSESLSFSQQESLGFIKHEKVIQVQVQMACMRAHKAVVIKQVGGLVQYMVCDRPTNTYQRVSDINVNVGLFLETHS